MALTGQTLSDFDNALKDTYGPGLREAINHSHPILTEVGFDTDNVQGRKFIWSVHSGRSSSTGSRVEGGTLPTADRQRYLDPEDTLRYIYHTIEVSGQALHLTKGTEGAFTRALESEMRGAERDVKNELHRQIYNEATTVDSVVKTGSIARVNGTPSTTTVVVNDNDGSSALSESVMRHFFVGMKVDFVTPATGVVTVAGATIATITPSTFTLTFTTDVQAAGALDNDLIFRAGSHVVDTANSEINGLRYLISTANYAGITAASNPVWNALTHGSSTEGISEVFIERGAQKVETDGNGDSPNLFLFETSQVTKLASLLQTQKRYDGKLAKLTAGWEGIKIHRGVLLDDRYCPTLNGFGLTTSELAWAEGHNWDWDSDDDGGVLYKVHEHDAIRARYKAYINLETYTRNAHVRYTLAAPTF